jgi:polar amino acid transport system substrate-binding protein
MHVSTWLLRRGGAAITVVALMLAGCGGAGAAGSGGTASSPPATSGATSTSVAAASGVLGQVERTGQLTVALAPFAPLEFQSSTTKRWEGFDVDFLSAFARTLHANLVVDDMAFAATIQAVHDGRADITANIFKTKSREKEIAFSEPVLNYVEGVIVNSVHPQVTVDSKAGLSGKTIATCRGCAEEAFVPLIPGAKDESYSTADDTFEAVSAGRVDAAFQPVMYEQYAVRTNPALHIKVLGPIPASIAGSAQKPQGFYGVAPGSSSQSLLQALNTFITRSCRDGDTQKILDRYGLTSSSYLEGLC